MSFNFRSDSFKFRSASTNFDQHLAKFGQTSTGVDPTSAKTRFDGFGLEFTQVRHRSGGTGAQVQAGRLKVEPSGHSLRQCARFQVAPMGPNRPRRPRYSSWLKSIMLKVEGDLPLPPRLMRLTDGPIVSRTGLPPFCGFRIQVGAASRLQMLERVASASACPTSSCALHNSRLTSLTSVFAGSSAIVCLSLQFCQFACRFEIAFAWTFSISRFLFRSGGRASDLFSI